MKYRALLGILLLPACAFAQETPWRDVTIYRDAYGVPHVAGASLRAAAFGFGYAQAADHLEPMLLAYRMANGRLAEVMGTAQADSDAFALKLGHARMAREALPNADPATADLCTGFAQGVNAWLAEHPQAAPSWAEGVAPADVLALWHCFTMGFAPFDLDGAFRRTRPFDTGNAWAVAPSKTAEGNALLAINPHEYYDGPFRWYEAHLTAGDYDVYGATLFGLPILLLGFNTAAGWALTPNAPDTADFFEERVLPGKPKPWWRLRQQDSEEVALQQQQRLILQYASTALPFFVRTENGLERRETPVLSSPLGPVFDRGVSSLYSWAAGGYFDLGGLRQLYEMGRARSLDAFQQALELRQLPCFNVVYADADGKVFYLYNAKVGTKLLHAPDQKPDPAIEAKVSWKQPIPAEVTVYDWAGPVPLASLPSVTDPPAGFVQACGGPPWQCTDDAPIDPNAWPAWLFEDAPSGRAERARTMLRGPARSFDEHQHLLFDTIVPAAERYVPMLLALAEEAKAGIAQSHPDLAGALEILRDWNYSASGDARAMSFFHVWWRALRTQTRKSAPSDAALCTLLDANTAESQRLMLDTAADAARMLRNDLRDIARPWGDAHRMKRGTRDEPIGGASTGDPVFLIGDNIYNDGRWYAEYGFGFGLVVQFGDAPRAASLSPFGTSERAASPHFADQLDLLHAGRMKPVYFAPGDVQRHAEGGHGHDLRFLPAGLDGEVRLQSARAIEATLKSSNTTPAPLPPRLAAYSVFVTVDWTPADARVEANFQALIPAERCPAEKLTQLGIYLHEEGLGWYRAKEQSLNASTLRFSAQGELRGTIVVLGPELEMKKKD